jgi:electron transport complex protein RnfG
MKEVAKLSLALGTICALAAAALAFAYSATSEAITETQLARQAANLRKVLPEYGNEILGDRVVLNGRGETVRREEIKLQPGDTWFFIARTEDGGTPVATAAWTAARGFGGPVEVLVGIDPDGSVRKVLVVQHAETPGLGTQVTDRQKRVTIFDMLGETSERSQESALVAPNAFLDSFENFTFDGRVEISLGPDLQPGSGATISSAAVAQAVAKAATAFARNRTAILGQPKP